MIIVKNLIKKFGNRVIIDDFSYHFPKNTKIGIIGANGAGKTTFLNLITSIDEYDSGSIIIPKDCVLGYLPQSPCENPKNTILEECISGHLKLCALEEELHASLKKMEKDYSDEIYAEYEKIEKEFADNDGYALEAEAKGILVGLGFENSQFEDSPLILSGGWRMRLELAKLLINEPNFLILDEPTNHLDLPSLTWLEQYLKSFRGTLLFVSHDRDFLNNIAEQIIHISHGNVSIYNGNFEDFLEQREAKTEFARKQMESIKKKQDHLQEFVDRFRYKATKAKQAQSKLKVIEKLKKMEERIGIEDSEKRPTFKMEVEKQSSKIVLEIKNGTIGYEDIALNKGIDLRVIRGNKIAIIGANGIGKTTLLKTIIGEIQLLSGEMNFGNNVTIGYYSQEQLETLDPKEDALTNVLNLARNINHQQARAILGCLLITKDEVKKQVHVLSGGERSKVAIAALLAQRNNFLILDEPTNHLDMSSAEALSMALAEYGGTVIAVSHNRSFISSFATHIFKMDKTKKAELIGADT
ncbi:MAG: ATP-binding cassette domain-containing protein [Holosporales bacterium]|jgi:ATP-binding cassette subfamily F protein 3|nr:ATP-binding cassette domain-containing protein [Holosporales bacterium]